MTSPLLDALRDYLHLTGTKKGCDHGVCGACTVLINGQRRISCLTLAVMHEAQEIKTIEGVASEGALHALQSAFIRHDAFQCGYCTPGQIMSSLGLLEENEVRSEQDIGFLACLPHQRNGKIKLYEDRRVVPDPQPANTVNLTGMNHADTADWHGVPVSPISILTHIGQCKTDLVFVMTVRRQNNRQMTRKVVSLGENTFESSRMDAVCLPRFLGHRFASIPKSAGRHQHADP